METSILLYYKELLSKVLNYLNVPLGTIQIFFFCFHIFTYAIPSPCFLLSKMFIGVEFIQKECPNNLTNNKALDD